MLDECLFPSMLRTQSDARLQMYCDRNGAIVTLARGIADTSKLMRFYSKRFAA